MKPGERTILRSPGFALVAGSEMVWLLLEETGQLADPEHQGGAADDYNPVD